MSFTKLRALVSVLTVRACNSGVYSELEQPIRARENHNALIWSMLVADFHRVSQSTTKHYSLVWYALTVDISSFSNQSERAKTLSIGLMYATPNITSLSRKYKKCSLLVWYKLKSRYPNKTVNTPLISCRLTGI